MLNARCAIVRQMGRIVLLPDEVASQVAAGEVVERPASVVKELVENSIDANASRIEVGIGGGGASFIRVVDDGHGMDRDDALLSLERHATSKIRTGQDLARVATLGFRGEALPSIASVSRFRLVTRPADALEGTEIIVNGGKIESVNSSGEAPGSQVEARSLFYNLPARRKFLRSENTEASHVHHQLMLLAVGHPGIGFTYLRDKAVVFQTPPVGGLVDRVRDLRGQVFLDQLIELQPTNLNAVQLSGLIGKAGVSRATRSEQIIFVNGRAIDNLSVQHGIREGYHTALMKGQYAVTFLFLELDPEKVDVNVHPAKREVRFRDPDQIRNAVAAAVRQGLESDRRRWSAGFQHPASNHIAPENQAASITPKPVPNGSEPSAPLIPLSEQFALRKDWAAFPISATAQASPAVSIPPPGPMSPTEPPEEFKILGVLGKLYVLLESDKGLVLVDQHAAHERILFERLRAQLEQAGAAAQRLLIPITLPVAPRDYDWLLANSDTLQKMGFLIEPFGSSTVKIDGLPQMFQCDQPATAVRQLIDELRSHTALTSKLRLSEDVIAKTVCRHAIKANDDLRMPEIEQLIADLLACDLPYCCPHGRPTMIEIGYPELEKKFGRRV